MWAQAKSKSATAVQKKCLTAAGASAAGPAAAGPAAAAAAAAGGGGAYTRSQAVSFQLIDSLNDIIAFSGAAGAGLTAA